MANQAHMQKYLEGADYPLDKSGIIDHAEKSGAPAEIITALGYLEDRDYASAADVSTELEGGEILP